MKSKQRELLHVSLFWRRRSLQCLPRFSHCHRSARTAEVGIHFLNCSFLFSPSLTFILCKNRLNYSSEIPAKIFISLFSLLFTRLSDQIGSRKSIASSVCSMNVNIHEIYDDFVLPSCDWSLKLRCNILDAPLTDFHNFLTKIIKNEILQLNYSTC